MSEHATLQNCEPNWSKELTRYKGLGSHPKNEASPIRSQAHWGKQGGEFDLAIGRICVNSSNAYSYSTEGTRRLMSR